MSLPSATRRVLRPSTTRTLTQMLAYVVQDGTGISAQIPDTRWREDRDRQEARSERALRQSVRRLVHRLPPASRPRVVVAVIIDEPRTVYGGVAAAPVIRRGRRYARSSDSG